MKLYKIKISILSLEPHEKKYKEEESFENDIPYSTEEKTKIDFHKMSDIMQNSFNSAS